MNKITLTLFACSVLLSGCQQSDSNQQETSQDALEVPSEKHEALTAEKLSNKPLLQETIPVAATQSY